MTSAKADILARIRQANSQANLGFQAQPIPRDYHRSAADAGVDEATLVDLLVDRLIDYRAEVQVVSAADLPHTIGQVLGSARRVGVAPGISQDLLVDVQGDVQPDSIEVPPTELNELDAVLTSSAVTCALTGTIVLDGSDMCGRRALTLVPDRHVCLVPRSTIVYGIPETMTRLAKDPCVPMTMISGPSATSDIELERVEGVHGPRTLQVIIVDDA